MDFLKNRPLLKFILSFFLAYALLLASNEIKPIQKAHHAFFASFGQWVYNTWHPEIKADISTDLASIGADPKNDYVLTAYSKEEVASISQHNRVNPLNPKQQQPTAYMAFKARMSHSIATFFLLALIWATPNNWKRKVIGSFIALYILYILVAMKLTFLMSMADGSKTPEDGIWYFLSNIIGNNQSYQELYYILLLSIWILVSLSTESINKLVGLNRIKK